MTAKQAAATAAIEFVEAGMLVGLGTGSTAALAIAALGQKVSSGLSITAVASSVHSESLATAAGIAIVTFNTAIEIDVYIDGADEIDPGFNLMKGGGGALLREKILAYNSKKFVAVIGEEKKYKAWVLFRWQ